MYKDIIYLNSIQQQKLKNKIKPKGGKKGRKIRMFKGGVVSATGYYDHTTFCET